MSGLADALTATLAALLALAPAPAQAGLVVHSDGECPNAQAVREALWAIRPEVEWPALTATVRVLEDRLQVSLGAERSQWREVPAPPDCSDRASRAAVVIAVWSGELPAQTTSAPTLSVAMPAPLPAPAATVRRPPMATELGLTGFYSLIGGMAPGAQFELGRSRRADWWSIRATAAYQSTKSLRVDIGRSDYSRALLGAALGARWEPARYFLSSHWGIAGSYTRAYGDGYSENQFASGVNVGLSADGRVGLRLGAFSVWAGGLLYRWVRTETIRVDALSGDFASMSRLPAWDLHFGLGVGLAFD